MAADRNRVDKRSGRARHALARLTLACGLAALAIAGTATAQTAAPAPAPAPAQVCPPAWPAWTAFKTHFLQPDGRVLDASTPRQHSSSEGQSYGMFFALVAGDRPAFEQMWRWAEDNLAGGDIAQRLPAWHWGRRDDGKWGILDANSASDADVWLVYALLEAGERWQRPDYRDDALALLTRIEAEEVVRLPGLGAMLLPGRDSFARPDQLWQLNPSYLPVPVLRRLAAVAPKGPWNEVAENSVRLLDAATPAGFVADWVGYRATGPARGMFVPDPLKGDVGSYDAIRSYLWAGITPADDPLAAPSLAALDGMTRAVATTGLPPESVATNTGAIAGTGPFGFSAALIPFFEAGKHPWLAAQQRRRVDADWTARVPAAVQTGQQPPYYDVVLTLFALGWADGRYRFTRHGNVQLPLEESCPPVPKS